MQKNKKQISKTVKIQSTIQPNRQVVIDGQVVPATIYSLYCPDCGRIIYSFEQPGISFPDALKIIADNKVNLLTLATYCPACGIRVNYDLEIIDIQVDTAEERQSEEETGKVE